MSKITLTLNTSAAKVSFQGTKIDFPSFSLGLLQIFSDLRRNVFELICSF